MSEAIVLQQLHYWLKRTNNQRNGRKWVYNTSAEWLTQFPFMSEDTLGRVFKSLVKRKLVKIEQFNKKRYDWTNWYTIQYAELRQLIPELEALTKKLADKKAQVLEVRLRRYEGANPADCGDL